MSRSLTLPPSVWRQLLFPVLLIVARQTDVKFKTESGKKVEFEAKKPVKAKVKVQFKAKDK